MEMAMEQQQEVVQASSDDQHTQLRDLLLQSSLSDLKTQSSFIPALSSLIPTSFLASLSENKQAQVYRYILICWAVTGGKQCLRHMQLQAALSLWKGLDTSLGLVKAKH